MKFRYNEWLREFFYLFKPFFDDNINASYTLFNLFLLIPFLRIWIFRLKVSRTGKNLKLKYPVYVQNGRNISLGDNATFGSGCHIQAGRKSVIKIGNNLTCGPGAMIFAASHGSRKGELIKYQDLVEKDIVMGDDVFLGAGSVVLEGTTLADGTLVGANSVVGPNFKNEPFEILQGVPAKLKRKRKA